MQILGIQLMIKENFSEEKEINLNHQQVENLFKMVMLSFYSLENIKEEESLFLKL
jgi:hypothetical protein